MEIQGLSYGNNGINNIDSKATQKVSQKNLAKGSDSVENSGLSIVKDSIDEISIIETEFEPRIALMKEVAERLSNGAYNTLNILREIGGKLIDADVATDAISYISEEQLRHEKVDEVNNNIVNNYYDNPEVKQEIAVKFIENIGISKLFDMESNK